MCIPCVYNHGNCHPGRSIYRPPQNVFSQVYSGLEIVISLIYFSLNLMNIYTRNGTYQFIGNYLFIF